MITVVIGLIIALMLICIIFTVSETTPGFMVCGIFIGMLAITVLLIDETAQPYIIKNLTNNKVNYTQCKSVEEVTINGEKITLCEFISNDEKAKNEKH